MLNQPLEINGPRDSRYARRLLSRDENVCASAWIIYNRGPLIGIWRLIIVVMAVALVGLMATAFILANFLRTLVMAARAVFRSTVDTAISAVIADTKVARP